MNYKPRKTTCSTDGCENPRRQSSGYCLACHAAKQKEYRQMAKELHGDGNGLLAETLRETKKRVVIAEIVAAGGKFGDAAIRLGIHRNSITRILEESGVCTLDLRKAVRELQRNREREGVAA